MKVRKFGILAVRALCQQKKGFPAVFIMAGVWLLLAGQPAWAADHTPSRIYKQSVGSIVQFDIVRSDGKRLTATGFVVRPGLVATNAHVVRQFADGSVFYGSPTKREVIAGIVDTWPEVDLALVSVPGIRPLPPVGLKLAGTVEDAALQIGDPVYIIGSPGGLTNTFTTGQLSARRKLDGFDTLQLTASSTYGSSGSPVIDGNGSVVGVIRSTAIPGTDIVLATPVAYLQEMLRNVGSSRVATRRSAPERETTSSASISLTPPNNSANVNGTTIVLGVPQGVSAEATAHILKAAIEAKYPYKVELRRDTNAKILAEIARPDSHFDVHVEVWLPNQLDMWNAHVKDRSNVLTTSGYTGFQGLCVNGPVSAQYGIRSIDDLRKPGIAKLFDHNGDGKGEIWLGDPGWNAPDINRVKIRDHDLSGLYTGFESTERSYLPKLVEMLAANTPVVFYCYLPHWMVDKYDIVTLDEPPFSESCYSVRNPSHDPDWLRNSKAACAGPTPEIRLVYSARLERKAPGVAQFLSQLYLNASLVSKWASIFKDSKAHPTRVANAWISRNPGFVDPRRTPGRW